MRSVFTVQGSLRKVPLLHTPNTSWCCGTSGYTPTHTCLPLHAYKEVRSPRMHTSTFHLLLATPPFDMTSVTRVSVCLQRATQSAIDGAPRPAAHFPPLCVAVSKQAGQQLQIGCFDSILT